MRPRKVARVVRLGALELVARKRPNGLFDEHLHVFASPDIAAGKHTATATVRELATRREVSQFLRSGRPDDARRLIRSCLDRYRGGIDDGLGAE